MKLIIAGSRDIKDYHYVETVIEQGLRKLKIDASEVICGDATGVDACAAEWAKKNNIPFRVFNAEWDRYGRAAGPIRNAQMAREGDALIAIWKSGSKGTKNMIDEARAKNLKIYVYEVPMYMTSTFLGGAEE